jgi:hypothetical protein
MKILMLTLWTIVFCSAAFGQPVFSEKPSSRQLFARNLANNLAAVSFTGSMTPPGAGTYVIKRFRYPNGADLAGDGIFDTNLALPLSGSFSLKDNIPAGLINYRYRVYQVIGPGNEVAAGPDIAREVVAGDAYLVYGQSNAESAAYTGDANIYQNIFIRGIGTRSETPPFDFSSWDYAEGNEGAPGVTGSIGQWPLYLGNRLVNRFEIPVAFVSYPRGGAQIWELQRDDDNPMNLSTNYGRLLSKAQASGLANRFRGILYFQGESDAAQGTSKAYYKSNFNSLYEDWQADFSGFEKVYVFQVRPGCAGSSALMALETQQAQKELADELGPVDIISTSHLDHYSDNCHYGFASYVAIGSRTFSLLSRDLYNSSIPASEISPVPIKAAKGSAGKLLLQVSPMGESYGVDASFKDLVKLEGAGTYAVNGVAMQGDILEIDYAFTGAEPVSLSVLGTSGSASPSLYNNNGIGILSVQGLQIESSLPIYFSAFSLQTRGNVQVIAWDMQDNDRFESFEVQESRNGRDWVILLQLGAKPGTEASYMVSLPDSKASGPFFRILAKKSTGEPVYSNVLQQREGANQKNWQIYPNPVSDMTVLAAWSDKMEQADYQLISSIGKCIYSTRIRLVRGQNTLPLPLPAQLPRGIYFVRIQSSSSFFQQKVVF